MSFIECEFQAGCDESTKVPFEVVDAPSPGGAWNGWQQEIDRDAAARKLPALGCRIAAFIVIRPEALLPQAVADLGVLLLVEQADGQANIEVVGTWMHVAGVWIGADLLVDQEVGDQATDDAQIIHQRAECHRHGQAGRLDLLRLLGRVAATIA
jgi:hypothetical protein